MAGKIVIEGNSVYEIDEACLIKKKEEREADSRKQSEKSECVRYQHERPLDVHTCLHHSKKSESF